MDQALHSLDALPPFPPILSRLMATLAEEDVSFAALGELIEKDAVIAANVLRLVNSALYARRSPVNSVRHAISLLGTNKLRNAVLGMSIARVWNRVNMPPTWSMARFNLHSAAVAILSDLLAQRLPVRFPEGAFVTGLLHDTGRLLIALALPREYQHILALHRADGRALVECETDVLGFTHAELSGEALRLWKLPKEMQIAACEHHKPSPPEPPEEFPLGQIVGAADQYVNGTGQSILPEGGNCGGSRASLGSLGLGPDAVQSLVADFRQENDVLAVYFR